MPQSCKERGEKTLGWEETSIKWEVTWGMKDLGDSEYALIKANPYPLAKKKKKKSLTPWYPKDQKEWRSFYFGLQNNKYH